ncbi:YihY/virulence factor BrkB family protein [Kineosporia sp. J2-2]|uniref:YihY/virulence factor BrkB family protein n=1 Tax=Kineosporia corallincola TaxID=2835133 RepID=A0ABS5TAT5_9ACTN|nr:YihY/virulence factor BrkB family protein [Kineosporia corallincola]MBT0767963.1 YihY/virulence factor BrkB family protein [Kineosporia corallincola]
MSETSTPPKTPTSLLDRAKNSVPWRAWQRYGKARGGVLAGGMAYAAFFSIFPALAVGFTVFGMVVGDDTSMQNSVIDAVNDGVGTTVISPVGGSGGIVSMDTLTGSSELTIAGIIGLVGFLFTGLGWLDAMREGMRAMFGQPTLEGNFVFTKGRDLGVLVSIGLLMLVSAVAGIFVSASTGVLLGWIGIDEGSTIGRVVLGCAGTLLVLGVDILIFMLLFRLLSGVLLPSHDLWDAALFGGIGLGILKLLSGVLLNGASENKFLATAGVALILLVWLNLVCRLTLVAAAWGATVAVDRGHLADVAALPESTITVRTSLAGLASASRPAASANPAAAGVRTAVPVPPAPYSPVVSPRAADRVSIAAGAVLGAAGLLAARTAAGAVRSVGSVFRRDDD